MNLSHHIFHICLYIGYIIAIVQYKMLFLFVFLFNISPGLQLNRVDGFPEVVGSGVMNKQVNNF